MGYTSESLVEAYELRENQWPPPGKEIVDVDGTKFMRDKNFKERYHNPHFKTGCYYW